MCGTPDGCIPDNILMIRSFLLNISNLKIALPAEKSIRKRLNYNDIEHPANQLRGIDLSLP
jgi:hypothetical protein